MISKSRRLLGAIAVAGLVAAACGNSGTTATSGECETSDTPTITFAAYSTPREVYGKIISAFQAKWKEENDDQTVIFQESYGGSTTQAQNVINGFEADIVALSLAPDVDVIKDAGLITHEWADTTEGGIVSTSIVVFDVRPGNPDDIEDFDDLAREGIEVLTPDPISSGGARWNIVAAYGSALRGYSGVDEGDEDGAAELLQGLFNNVTVLDKTARDSIKNFESGNGDVAITYENEILTAQEAGLDDEMVIPSSTVLIENPVAIVDENVDKHCVRPVAEAFVEFLHTDEVKELYASDGFLRPVDIEEAKKGDRDQFPPLEDVFSVEELGGWDELNEKLFGTEGLGTQAIENAQQ
ncbi:sulfate ABC transporter substrate-binding protein [soil metagenome]